MAVNTKQGFLFLLMPALLFACRNNGDDNKQVDLQNKERIECERRSPLCNGKDAMRFYQCIPVIRLEPDTGTHITEVWSSFVVCCDLFQRMMDSLTFYNDLVTEAKKEGREFQRMCIIDSSVTVSAGIEYFDSMSGKRWEWLHFGDSTFSWSLPTGEYFQEYKEKLEEAHARCCLL